MQLAVLIHNEVPTAVIEWPAGNRTLQDTGLLLDSGLNRRQDSSRGVSGNFAAAHEAQDIHRVPFPTPGEMERKAKSQVCARIVHFPPPTPQPGCSQRAGPPGTWVARRAERVPLAQAAVLGSRDGAPVRPLAHWRVGSSALFVSPCSCVISLPLCPYPCVSDG